MSRQKRRLETLHAASEELQDLIHRARKCARVRSAGDSSATATTLPEITSWAARLRTAAPVSVRLTPSGYSSEPLPPKAQLPFPPTRMCLQSALFRSSSMRAPPPEVVVCEDGSNRVVLKCFSPATEILYTGDSSLPRPGNPAARSVPSSSVVACDAALFLAAVGPGLLPSDVIVVQPSQAAPVISGLQAAGMPAVNEIHGVQVLPRVTPSTGTSRVAAQQLLQPADARSAAAQAADKLEDAKASPKTAARAKLLGSLAMLRGDDTDDESE
mmetsp:Transcript_43654/g.100731  ORF Transcript_43654/g.100731 Transcript_43654/m.100731 type:complete len:271 (+) Transcript_43654:60-872(+)